MPSPIKTLLVCLAILAVGIAQVFGMRTGYFCDCTGQRSVQETCQADDCHPSLAHEDDCGTGVAHSACANHDHGPQSPPADDHKHSEVREALIVTGVPPLLALPTVVFFELPPAFQVPDFAELFGWLTEIERPAPPGNGSPPVPLVARPMVMLV